MFEKEVMSKLENQNYTYKEIMTQVESWRKVYSDVIDEKFNFDLNIFSKNYDEIILFGCGSSYNLAISSSFYTNTLTKYKSTAVPSAELIFNTNTYIIPDKKYLLVGFSRSGETTETISVLEKLKNENNINSLVFTCNANNSLKNISNNSFYCEGAEEKSIVMTKSFSSMLFAYCLLIAKVIDDTLLLNEFNSLITYMNNKISLLFYDIKEYINKYSYEKLFTLGTGFNYGLAIESDLKTKEMTQVSSYSYYISEFNHGPKSLIDKNSLIMFLTLNEFPNNLINKMLGSLLESGTRIIMIGRNSLDKNLTKNVKVFLNDENFKNKFARSFINIPVFQILAYCKTISLNLNPDKPRNLEYTTKLK